MKTLQYLFLNSYKHRVLPAGSVKILLNDALGYGVNHII